MIARGSTIAAIFVAILSAFEDCPRVADGYVLPAPKFEILQPLGIRVSIPHEKGIGVFSFVGTMEKQDEEWGYDIISDVTYEPRRGMWTIQDEDVNVTNGDEIVYRMFAVVYGLQYIMNDTLIIHVGGVRIFPDGTSSSGIAKPWRNLGAKAMLQFWRAKNEWFPSWEHQNGKMTAFKIDYIRVWSFD